jgi:hypothetical protein
MQIGKKKKMLGKYDMHMNEMHMSKNKFWDVTPSDTLSNTKGHPCQHLYCRD